MDTTQKQPAKTQRAAPRRPYRPPRLVTHGTVAELTALLAGAPPSVLPDG